MNLLQPNEEINMKNKGDVLDADMNFEWCGGSWRYHSWVIQRDASYDDWRQYVTITSVVNLDPHWYGSILGGRIRIRIQEQRNWQKFTNKPEFQPFKETSVAT